ncbi:hypothetical protein N7E81_07445 [Reichenbachiella carrageenanivorans]|uniref:DinB family protein n=1 Tax=Reichenbachiella carrageenanivorans TaxID=2979869 RepID=A0ABY6D465_9BACT|nr:hypothetical protein [Reichenbachiella carrageenanivorans]UXX80932.1 hypothetical protein N7E81_07445 [Reichenbachiella carrageenanivorans]
MEIKPAVHRIFDQLTFLLENLTNEEYSKIAEVLSCSSIGQHVRHSLAFFTCLFQGIPLGVVNYDERERDVFLENNTLEALGCLSQLSEQLEGLTDNPVLVLKQSYDQTSIEVATNLSRELIYCIEHTVHHLALIKIGLKEFKPDLVLPKGFGVACSTIKYRQSRQVSA